MSYEDRKALNEEKKDEGFFGMVPKIPGTGMDEEPKMEPKTEPVAKDAPASPKEGAM